MPGMLQKEIVDPFDPNTWDTTPHEHRIYADDMAQVYAVVDEADYQWLIQWRWFATIVCAVRRRKQYMRRTSSRWQNGQRVGISSYYMHVEIMKRTGIQPPTPAHKVVDHRDGNGMNCRRSNLRWATLSMNARNVNGSRQHD